MSDDAGATLHTELARPPPPSHHAEAWTRRPDRQGHPNNCGNIFLIKKVPDTEKLPLRENGNESAVMIVLQMAVEEVETQGLNDGGI